MSIFVAKDQLWLGYRVIWCINHRLQSNQFVGRPDEEEEEKRRWRKLRFDRFPCSILATLGVLSGRESLANHDQIPKKAFKSSTFVRVKAFTVYGGIGVSAPSLHTL